MGLNQLVEAFQLTKKWSTNNHIEFGWLFNQHVEAFQMTNEAKG